MTSTELERYQSLATVGNIEAIHRLVDHYLEVKDYEKVTNIKVNIPNASSTTTKINTTTDIKINSTANNTTKNVSTKKPNSNQDKMNKLKAMGKSQLLLAPKKECEICHRFIESHLHKIHVNGHPSQIFKWMYLGTFENACDIMALRRLGINYILNCASDCKNTV